MSGALIDVKLDDARFQGLCREVEKRAGDMAPAMKLVGEVVTQSVRTNFEAGGRPTAWKPLAQSTLWGLAGGSSGHVSRGGARMSAATERRMHSKKVLVDRGMAGGLMGSIHYEASADQVLVGTEKPYGAIHQMGGKVPAMTIRPSYKQALYWPDAVHPVKEVHRPEITIPARPYLMVQDEDLPVISDAIGRWLVNA